VVQQHGQGCFPQSPYFLASIARSLFGHQLGSRSAIVLRLSAAGVDTWKDFDCELNNKKVPGVSVPETSKKKKLTSAHLLSSDVMCCQLHFSHAPCTQCFAQRVISKNAIRPALSC
jgi:hypothetical protein